jgi:hypothetical protein
MSEFARADYLRIKWSFVALAGSLVVGISLFAGLRMLNEKATAQLRDARTANEEARQKVDRISQEEATIRANIGRYQGIKESGMVGEKDILQMDEHFGKLRSEHALFVISMTRSSQNPLPIAYGELDGKRVDNPGRPIVLQTTNINFKLPLLHENDFALLLDGLLSLPEVLQVQNCSITNRIRSEQSVPRLSQNQSAECNLIWYSFRFDDPRTKTERKR